MTTCLGVKCIMESCLYIAISGLAGTLAVKQENECGMDLLELFV